MNGKIRIFHNKENQIFVSGLDLHRALNCQTPYRKWFRSYYKLCGVEGTDYFSIPKCVYSYDGRLMPQKQHEHYLSIRMAKCVCLFQPGEISMECYDYLQTIADEWEKKQLSPPKQNPRQNVPENHVEKLEKEKQTLRDKVRRLEEENYRLHVKADFFDALFPAGIEMPMPGVLACRTDHGNIFYDMRLKMQNSGKPANTVH